MLSFLVLAVICASCLANPVSVHYSFSRAVGVGSGSNFSINGQGRITAVRLWEVNNAYITGIQLRYEYIWTQLVGRRYGNMHELDLFEDEVIIQVSGKYHSNYIYRLIFVTSRGRSLIVGRPVQRSFNMYPKFADTELRMLSGRFNSAGITALAAHWGVVDVNAGNSTTSRT